MWVPTEKEALMKHRVCIQLQISRCGFFFSLSLFFFLRTTASWESICANHIFILVKLIWKALSELSGAEIPLVKACLRWLQQRDESSLRLCLSGNRGTAQTSVAFVRSFGGRATMIGFIFFLPRGESNSPVYVLEWLIRIEVWNFENWIRWLKRGGSVLMFATIWTLRGSCLTASEYRKVSKTHPFSPLFSNAPHSPLNP